MEEKRSTGKVIAIVSAVVVLSAALAFFLASRGDTTNNSETTTPTTTQTTQSDNNDADNPDGSQQSETLALTVKEVEKHNSEDDCWTIIRGNVYDLTSFIARHPGGDEIERACGEDATTLFETRTDENGEPVGSGTPHSGSAESQLETLLLGPLEN